MIFRGNDHPRLAIKGVALDNHGFGVINESEREPYWLSASALSGHPVLMVKGAAIIPSLSDCVRNTSGSVCGCLAIGPHSTYLAVSSGVRHGGNIYIDLDSGDAAQAPPETVIWCARWTIAFQHPWGIEEVFEFPT